MIIIIDFDGTIAEFAWPAIGKLRKNAAKVINRLYDEGHKIIIDTCRTGPAQIDAEEFLEKHGIKYHVINENLPETIAEFELDSRKLSGDLRIDDLNLGGIPDDWETKYYIIQQHPKYKVDGK